MQHKALRVAATLAFFFWGISEIDPSWVNSWWGIFPSALCFMLFAAGVLGWGLWFERRTGGGGGSVYLFSSAVAVCAGFILGHLGLLGSSGRWIFLVALTAGVWIAPSFEKKKIFILFPLRWETGVFFFIFFLRGFSAYLPHAHGDPLLYHLMAPRIWNLQGAVRLNHDLPIPLLASTWEYFFLWPQVLFAPAKDSLNQLIFAQIVSQWIHLVWGLYGAAFVLRGLWHRAIPEPLASRCELAVLCSLLFVNSMQWTAGLAKNDCGVALWCLGAWFFLQLARGQETYRYWMLSGLFSGLAVAGKINAILFIIPLFALYLALNIFERVGAAKTARYFIALGLGAAVGALPIYLRNWVETGNPFYTMFSHWFPSYWVSKSWAQHFSVHQPTNTHFFQMALYRIKQLSHESPGLWLLILAPIAWLYPSSRGPMRALRDWILLFLLSLLLCFVAVAENAEVRYLGASLWLGAALGSAIFLLLLQNFPQKVQRVGGAVLLIGLLASSKIPTHLLWKFPKILPGQAMVLQHSAGAAKAWLRQNVPAERLIVIHGDNETYYLSGLRVTVLTERPDIDAATYGKTDLQEFLKGLCDSSGAGVLLDARESGSLKNKFPAGPWDQAVLFSEGGARVYDLLKLQSLVLGGRSAGCGRT